MSTQVATVPSLINLKTPTIPANFSDLIEDGIIPLPKNRTSLIDYDLTPLEAKYEIKEEIGSGGFGVVFKAYHKLLNSTVALKVLHKKRASENTFISRFQREMKIAGTLDHPAIVKALDADIVDGLYYLAMEYCDGLNLEDLIKRNGPIGLTEALEILRKISEGLEHAHRKNVIHRDIKPSNFMLLREGEIRILDFGMAYIQDELVETNDITQSYCIMGTVSFMSPEQAKDLKIADQRSDIYSLGCTLYYLLTGKPIFPSASIVDQILAHREEPVPILPNHPVPVWFFLKRMTEKSPKMRFQNMAEVISAIDVLLSENLTNTDQKVPERLKFVSNETDMHFKTVELPQTASEKPASKASKTTIISTIVLASLLGLLFTFYNVKDPGSNLQNMNGQQAGNEPVALTKFNSATESQVTNQGQDLIQGILDSGGTLVVMSGNNKFEVKDYSNLPKADFQIVEVLFRNLSSITLPPHSNSSQMNHLNRFVIYRSPAERSHVELFVQSNSLTDIQFVNASITDSELNLLSHLSGIKYLSLQGNDITEQGLDILENMVSIRTLNLSKTGATDATALHLSRMPDLKWLNICNTKITDQGIKLLEKCNSLEELFLTENTLSSRSLEHLQAALPNCKISILRK
ncbi:MAG: protein kinase [Planctomycetaceae bacterium]|nr:protein kinase [Planctomycetaceae bacterium]